MSAHFWVRSCPSFQVLPKIIKILGDKTNVVEFNLNIRVSSLFDCLLDNYINGK